MGLTSPRLYECMFVASQGLGEGEVENLIKGLVSGLTEVGVEVRQNHYLGLIEFAYEIKKSKRGHYFVLLLSVSDLKKFSAFAGKLGFNELVVRYRFFKLKSEECFQPHLIRVGDPVEGERGDRDRGDRPRGDRHRGDGDRHRGDGDRGDRPRGDGDRGDRPRGDGDRGDRPRGDGDRGDRPRGDGDRGDRPRGDGDRGDRPRGDGDRS